MSALRQVDGIFIGHGMQVHVCKRVERIWHDARQTTSRATEACGVLIGSVSKKGNSVWLEFATGPKPLDLRSRFSFRMKDPGHARIVQRKFVRSHQTRVYLGTWHTHPARAAKPSLIDRRDWCRCTRRNPDRPMVFVIVGIDEVALYGYVNGTFKALKKRD